MAATKGRGEGGGKTREGGAKSGHKHGRREHKDNKQDHADRCSTAEGEEVVVVLAAAATTTPGISIIVPTSYPPHQNSRSHPSSSSLLSSSSFVGGAISSGAISSTGTYSGNVSRPNSNSNWTCGPRPRAVVHETPLVLGRAEGFIASEIQKKQWIYGIIAGERESEAVMHDEGEFMILPDSDALNDGVHVVNWLVIFKDLGLRSLRDLRGVHVGLLRRVKAKILDLFPFKSCMMYFHCPPSVWQLHLHVSAPCDVLRTTNDMQKVQFLDDVMSNLGIDPDYYAKATLTYVLPIGHEFIRLYHGGGGGPSPS